MKSLGRRSLWRIHPPSSSRQTSMTCISGSQCITGRNRNLNRDQCLALRAFAKLTMSWWHRFKKTKQRNQNFCLATEKRYRRIGGLPRLRQPGCVREQAPAAPHCIREVPDGEGASAKPPGGCHSESLPLPCRGCRAMPRRVRWQHCIARASRPRQRSSACSAAGKIRHYRE